MTSEQASLRVQNLGKRNANALSLAQLLSFAALAEPALIRKMRLELLPASSAADEADLWFSNLVQSRSPDGLVLYPEVAEILRRGLAAKSRNEAWERTQQTHRGYRRAIQIEEELTYLALEPEANQARIDELFGEVISAMVGGRTELANWAGRALPRLPSTVQSWESAAALRIAADFRLGRNPNLRGALAPFPSMPAWVELVLPRLPRVRLGVKLTNQELSLGPIVADPSESLPYSIEVPDTPTVAVEVRWTAKDAPRSKILFVEKGGISQPEKVDGGPIELITLANETWTLKPADTQTGQMEHTPPAIAAYTDGYAVTIHWRSREEIPGCLGFVVMRRRRTAQSGYAPEPEEILASYVGLTPSPGREPSTRNPLQRFSWVDSPTPRDTEYSYRVVPVAGKPGDLHQMDALSSAWTPWIRVGAQVDAPISVAFNRTLDNAGLLGLSPQELGDLSRRGLQEVISQPGHPVRQALGGDLLSSLTTLLSQAEMWSYNVYVAMFELSDPEMVEFLEKMGKRANVVLANGAPKPRERDSNSKVRERLRRSGVPVWDRIFPPGRLAHNKFLVLCDADLRPITVWTGNVSWTSVAFCAKSNAAVMVNSRPLAEAYLTYWKQLAGSAPRDPGAYSRPTASRRISPLSIGPAKIQPWFTTALNLADIQAAAVFIQTAKQGILFLLSEPGQKGSLLSTILRQKNIFLMGATRHGPTLTLYRNQKESRISKAAVTLPLMDSVEGAKRSSLPLGAALQSRMIVIDPMGSHPVVMIGSHAFGERGSIHNEESFLIIENDPEVAHRCAAHVDAYYRHYSFRANVSAKPTPLRLQSDDKWQRHWLQPDAQSEMGFWLGEEARTFEVMPSLEGAQESTISRRSSKPATPAKPVRKKPAKATARQKAAPKPAVKNRPAKKAPAKPAGTARSKAARVSRRAVLKKKKK